LPQAPPRFDYVAVVGAQVHAVGAEFQRER